MKLQFINQFGELDDEFDGVRELNFNTRFLGFKCINPNTGETTSKTMNFSEFEEIRIVKE